MLNTYPTVTESRNKQLEFTLDGFAAPDLQPPLPSSYIIGGRIGGKRWVGTEVHWMSEPEFRDLCLAKAQPCHNGTLVKCTLRIDVRDSSAARKKDSITMIILVVDNKTMYIYWYGMNEITLASPAIFFFFRRLRTLEKGYSISTKTMSYMSHSFWCRGWN